MNGLSNPRIEGSTLTAECGGQRVNCCLLIESRRRANITLLITADDGDKVAAYATDRLHTFTADVMLEHYTNWQDHG